MNKPKIILIIASSIDGRIAYPHGGESHLGSLEDRKILSESLSKVDATIFGSGTLKAHKSTFLVKEKYQNISHKQPVSIIAGNSNTFSDKWLYFKQPIKRWLISSEVRVKKNIFNFDKEFLFKGTWKKTLEVFQKEGIKNIALLGGAKLISSFSKENLIDEIKITIVPKIIGGNFTWINPIIEKDCFNSSSNWIVHSLKELNTNEIFIHYTRKKRD